MIEAVKNQEGSLFHVHKSGALYGVTPAWTGFGFLYFAHLVPPEKPDHSLHLGYGFGTVADLQRKIWGSDCKITAVDMMGYQKVDAFQEYAMEVMDAKQYVWESTESLIKRRFDFIMIDLWEGKDVCDFIFEVEFVVRLREMAKKFVCMNVTAEDVKRCRNFYDYGFKFRRSVPIEGNQILWWEIC